MGMYKQTDRIRRDAGNTKGAMEREWPPITRASSAYQASVDILRFLAQVNPETIDAFGGADPLLEFLEEIPDPNIDDPDFLVEELEAALERLREQGPALFRDAIEAYREEQRERVPEVTLEGAEVGGATTGTPREMAVLGDVEDFLSAQRSQFERELRDIKNDAEKTLEEIENSKDRAVTLVEKEATSQMAEQYEKDAKVQYELYEEWVNRTVGGFLALALFGLGHIVVQLMVPWESPWSMASRAPFFLAIAAFTAYAGRMSTIHRDSERRVRYRLLALQSLDAFLGGISVEGRREIKGHLARDFFMDHTIDRRKALQAEAKPKSKGPAPSAVDELSSAASAASKITKDLAKELEKLTKAAGKAADSS